MVLEYQFVFDVPKEFCLFDHLYNCVDFVCFDIVGDKSEIAKIVIVEVGLVDMGYPVVEVECAISWKFDAIC